MTEERVTGSTPVQAGGFDVDELADALADRLVSMARIDARPRHWQTGELVGLEPGQFWGGETRALVPGLIPVLGWYLRVVMRTDGVLWLCLCTGAGDILGAVEMRVA